MKRGFTLIEMMIVVAVLVTLMAITFRIGRVASETEARSMTISRLQRIENALSGFHAAFGCYPPVKVHGDRRLLKADGDEIQWGDEGEAWAAVERVCRSQPIGCRFPFPPKVRVGNTMIDTTKEINELNDEIGQILNSGDSTEEYKNLFENNTPAQEWARNGFRSSYVMSGTLDGLKDKSLWSEVKLFQYGVMSFLLPRYFVMMRSDSKYYNSSGRDEDNIETGGYAQWTKNNLNPSDPSDGDRVTWSEIKNLVDQYYNNDRTMDEDVVKLRMMPSQAVCARWMPNLDEICKCNYDIELFGVNIKSSYWKDKGIFDGGQSIEYLVKGLRASCFVPNDDAPYQNQYILDEVTVCDGWGNELYYYSRSPYQSYTLWSAGPDGRTFPPWISRKNLTSSNVNGTSEADRAAKWTRDDIVQLSN